MSDFFFLSDTGGGGGGAPVGAPTLSAQCAFGTDPGAAMPIWTDISAYVYADGLDMSRGRQRELELVQAGTAHLRLDNRLRIFDPTNTGSPYYPNVVPLRRLRIRAYLPLTGVTYDLFSGYVERWPQVWEIPDLADVPIDLVDGFEPLATMEITSTLASLTTGFGGDADLKFTAKSYKDGSSISVEYVIPVPGDVGEAVPLNIEVIQKAIRVELGLNSAGSVRTNARDLKAALLGNAAVSSLVDVELAAGSGGGGTPGSLPPTSLSGSTYQEERSGARINRALDDIVWPGSDRAIDTGKSMIAASGFAATAEQKALSHIQDVVGSELGVFFMDGAGKAVFHDRHHRYALANLTPRATFGDGAGELFYEDVAPEYSQDQIRNDVRVTRPEGVTQSSTDSASILRFYHRSYSRSPLLTSDGECLDQAVAIKNRYKDPHLRIEKIKLKPLDDTSLWQQVLGREIGDRINVKKRPPGGGTISQDSYIEAIRHRPGRVYDWETEFDLSPCEPSSPWLLGDSTYGVLGSTTRCAY